MLLWQRALAHGASGSSTLTPIITGGTGSTIAIAIAIAIAITAIFIFIFTVTVSIISIISIISPPEATEADLISRKRKNT